MKHAFPRKPIGLAYGDQYNGMTLREYYIGQALGGCCAAMSAEYFGQILTGDKGGIVPVRAAITIADKLLEILAQEPSA